MIKKSIYIKNMVCPRCITAVENTLKKLDIPFDEVSLGQAVIYKSINDIDISKLDKELKIIGFELIHDKSQVIVETVKTLIVDYIHHNDGEELKINFSDFLSEKIGKNYSTISHLFSDSEKVTIEKYIILQKIEKVKELIGYEELNFSQIAYKANYSSVAHLSKQFKQVSGLTLTNYKKLINKNRTTIDNISK
jgi:AraC-like DNA-binding protein